MPTLQVVTDVYSSAITVAGCKGSMVYMHVHHVPATGVPVPQKVGHGGREGEGGVMHGSQSQRHAVLGHARIEC